jgi:hypothetical protein
MRKVDFDKIEIDLHYITEMYSQPFEEFNIYLEDGESSNNANSSDLRDSKVTTSTYSQTKDMAKNNGIKLDISKKITMLLKRFTTWLSNAKQHIVMTFTKNFNAQIKYVENNAELNKEIASSIDGHMFNPKVENFPMFNIPLEEIVNHSKDIPTRLKPYTDNDWKSMLDPDINAIRALIYPDEVVPYDVNKMKDTNYHGEQFFEKKKEIDYWAMEQETDQEQQETESKEDESVKNKLFEYFLFGNVTSGGLSDDSHYTNQLTGKIWLDNCQNILNAKKAIEIGITGMCDNLKKESTNLDQLVEKAQADIDKLSNTDNPDEKTKKMLGEQERYIKRLQSMSTSLIKISNEYAVGFANTMQELFFKKCYNLYKDIVTEYKNTKDAYSKQQPDEEQNKPQTDQNEQKTPPPTSENTQPPVESSDGQQSNGEVT